LARNQLRPAVRQALRPDSKGEDGRMNWGRNLRATIPKGARLTVLPGPGKSFEAFQSDDSACRQWAWERTGATPSEAADQGIASGAAMGTIVGAVGPEEIRPCLSAMHECEGNPDSRRASRGASPVAEGGWNGFGDGEINPMDISGIVIILEDTFFRNSF